MALTFCPRCGSGPLENDAAGNGIECSDCGNRFASRILLTVDGSLRYEGRMTCCGCGRNNCDIGEPFCRECHPTTEARHD